MKDNQVVSFTKQYIGVGMKVAYFQKTVYHHQDNKQIFYLESLKMKSSETLSHDLLGTCNGSKSPVVFSLSTLTCWQMRQVLVYSITSSRIYGQ